MENVIKTPFICFDCDKETDVETNEIKIPCDCGGKMEIHYRDNYERDIESTICNTCTYNRVGEGEKCFHCSNI